MTWTGSTAPCRRAEIAPITSSNARCDSGRGDDGHDDQVGGAHRLLVGLGQPRRAIEQDAVIGLRQPVEQLRQPLLLVEFVEQQIEVAQRRIGGDQVEPRRSRSCGSILSGATSFEKIDCASSLGLSGVEQEAARGLRIEVPQQGAARRLRGGGPGEIDRQRRLSDAALQAVDRDRRQRVPRACRAQAGMKTGRRGKPPRGRCRK